MALENVLAQIPGLAGYLAMEQQRQNQANRTIHNMSGLLGLALRQQQEQRLAQMQDAQSAEIKRKTDQEQAGQTVLGDMFARYQALQQPTQVPASENDSVSTPGLSSDDALRKILPEMLFHQNPNVRSVGGSLIGRVEANDTRRAQLEVTAEARARELELRAQELARRAQVDADRASDREVGRDLQRQSVELQRQANAIRAEAAGRRQDPLIQVVDPKNPNRVIGMRESEYLRQRAAGNDLALAGKGIAGANNRQSQMLDKLQKEMEITNPIVKDFLKTKPFFTSAAEYMADVTKDPKKATSASDRALFFQYQKMLDPNDRVSEGDYRKLLQLGGLDERFVQYIRGLAEGNLLPDRVRRDMFAVMRRNFTRMNVEVQNSEARYRARAKTQGLNPDDLERYSVDLQ